MGTLWQHPDQVLVNTLGHLAGVLVFGIFLVLLVRQGRACRPHQARLPLVAATLAFLWNLASLAVLSVRDTSGRWSEIFAALGFSVLSLLPAVLFDLSLRGKWPRMAQVSYALSVFAISLHLSELYSDVADLHRIALALITVGFGALTAWASVRILRTATAEERSETPRLLATMALFLFAVSFVHFAEGHAQHAWSSELAFHHAGIPLALFVLLQDFRFVLLDAFLRFLTNGLLAVLFSVLLIAGATWTLAEPRDAFQQGLLLAAGCLLLILFALVRSGAQRLLTRLVFRQPDPELATQRIRQLAADSPDEPAFLLQASQFVAGLMAANLIDMPETSSLPRNLVAPAMASAAAPGLEPYGVVAIVPVRLAQEEPHLILLGARRGGRRYLSEDLNVLARLAAQIAEQIEILRDGELRRLVSQAELKALQAQIHPHFLFNAFNTLYGIIPKEAGGARRMVLHLAEMFRFFLQTDKTYIPLGEEVRLIEAYLEIERVRLGERLRTEICVDDDALDVPVPLLCIEPLVENAVKHGVAALPEGGLVRLSVHCVDGGLLVSVSDTGRGFGARTAGNLREHAGVGMENVERRLRLCYGPQAALAIDSSASGTEIRFRIPVTQEVGITA